MLLLEQKLLTFIQLTKLFYKKVLKTGVLLANNTVCQLPMMEWSWYLDMMSKQLLHVYKFFHQPQTAFMDSSTSSRIFIWHDENTSHYAHSRTFLYVNIQ